MWNSIMVDKNKQTAFSTGNKDYSLFIFFLLRTYCFWFSLVHSIVRTNIILIVLPVGFIIEYLWKEYIS